MDTTNIIKHLILAFPNLLAIYGFGSRFSGQAGPESDLDLAILIAGKVPPETLWEQSSQIAEISGYSTDLLDLRAASTVMQYQILTQGRRLWNKDAQADIYESFILSEKTALDTARAELLKDIHQSGRVYG